MGEFTAAAAGSLSFDEGSSCGERGRLMGGTRTRGHGFDFGFEAQREIREEV
jgi:hypothetical protein